MTTRSIVSFVDMLMATRPVLLIPVWGFSALGFQRAIATGSKTGLLHSAALATPGDYLAILVFSCSVAAVYVLNQLADIEADKNNGGMPLIATGVVSTTNAICITVCCSVLALVTPMVFHKTTLVTASALSLILGYFYSFKPTRFSGRPFVDFLSNATGYGIIAFGAGWYVTGRSPFSILFIYSALPYFLLMCAGSISSTLPDFDGDRKDNKNTTAVVFGKKKAHIAATLLLITSGIVGLGLHDMVAAVCAITPLPFYFGYLLHPNSFFAEATYKIGGAVCMVAAFIAMPFFIPLAIIVFIATWLYFRVRHGIAYPSLVPVKNS
jgi:4-hydroxybenzoate polyprenyltransferase